MSAAETWVLARAVVSKTLRLRIRHAFGTLGSLVVAALFFLVVVVAGRKVAPTTVAALLSDAVVAFVLLVTATVAYADLSRGLAREARQGTLEQLFMTPLGFGRVVVLRAAVTVCVGFGYGVVLLSLLVMMTAPTLRIDPVAFVAVGLPAVATAVGVGLALGGLALAFERVETLTGLVQLAFVALVAVPIEQLPLLKLLPLTLGSHLLRLAMVEGRPLWTLPATDLALLLVKAGAYLLAGYACLRFATSRARRRGTLGGRQQ